MRTVDIIDSKLSGSGWDATIAVYVGNSYIETLGSVEVWYGPFSATITVRIPARKTSHRKSVDAITPEAVRLFIQECTGHHCVMDEIKTTMEIYRNG